MSWSAHQEFAKRKTKEIIPFCDFDNIDRNYNSPFDPPEGEYALLCVYFPVETTNEQIKKAMEPITNMTDNIYDE